MTTNKYPLKRLVRNIATSGMPEFYDFEVLRRTILINVVSIIGILFLTAFGTLCVIQGTRGLGYLELFVATLLLLNILFFRKFRHYNFTIYCGISIMGALLVFLFAGGGVDNTGHLWCYIFPLFTTFLLGSRKGTIATLLFLSLCMIYLFADTNWLSLAVYPTNFKIRFTMSFLCVSAFTYLFAYMRERGEQNLAGRNEELQETISELKQTEHALRESEARFKETADLLPTIIFDVDKKLSFTYANNIGFETFGYSQKDLEEGVNLMELVHPDDREKVTKRIEQAFQGIGPSAGEYRALKKDGSELALLVNSTPIYKNGQLVGIRASASDITVRRELQAQLQRAQKMEAVGTLASGVAHDLNNILSGLVSYPELLLMQITEENPLRKKIETIKKSGEKAAAIVQDLLTLARRGVSTPEAVNINDVISEYLQSPEHEKLKQYHPKVRLEPNLEKDLLNILISPIHLSKTVMNLISNAAEAMPDGGIISVSTANRYLDRPIKGYDHVKEGEYVTLTVIDTGIGISPRDEEKIFEPFYTKKVMGRSGTGLGMAVVWGTVKDNKGYVDVQSVEGEGSSFTLYFPVTRNEISSSKSALPIENYMGTGQSILVVDDVEEQREIASEMLKALNYSVISVKSGEDAINYVNKNSADLLLLDMIMDPGIDGLDTYKRILEIHPGQKAIIASGFSETARVKEAQRLGAGAYLKKPYLLKQIGLAVKTELLK